MVSAPGTLLVKDPTRELREIIIDEKRFFLKRVFRSELQASIELYLTLQKPHSNPWREMTHIKHLQKAQIPVMDYAIAGEIHRWGFPAEGFILVAEVSGTSLDILYANADIKTKQRIAYSVGKLYGSLHVNGFYHPPRLQDIFAQKNGLEYDLQLIDRETRNPKPRNFSKQRSISNLKRGMKRHIQRGEFSITAEEIKHFCRGYTSTVNAQWSITPRQLIKKCRG